MKGDVGRLWRGWRRAYNAPVRYWLACALVDAAVFIDRTTRARPVGGSR
jgi:hypothetical protein